MDGDTRLWRDPFSQDDSSTGRDDAWDSDRGWRIYTESFLKAYKGCVSDARGLGKQVSIQAFRYFRPARDSMLMSLSFVKLQRISRVNICIFSGLTSR